jgi:hypothetical protein
LASDSTAAAVPGRSWGAENLEIVWLGSCLRWVEGGRERTLFALHDLRHSLCKTAVCAALARMEDHLVSKHSSVCVFSVQEVQNMVFEGGRLMNLPREY